MREKYVLPLAVVVCGLLTSLLAVGPATAAERPRAERGAAETATVKRRTSAGSSLVMNGPVFNDPTDGPASGTPSEAQRAVFEQLLGLIDSVPPGAEIRLAMHEWAPGESTAPQQVAWSLLDAHRRGVHVKIILNSSEKNAWVYDELGAELGHDASADSWVVACGSGRGCIARNYLHEKFALFSRVEWADGTTTGNVVFQSSSNLSDWYLFESYNDAYTFSDAQVYSGYVLHFADLEAGRHVPVNPDYFWTTRTGSTYKGLYYPRAESTGDTVLNILRDVECSYQEADGSRHQTDIRLVLTHFTKHRTAVAERLLELRGENCWIDVVYSEGNIESGPLGILSRVASNGKPIQLTPCRFETPEGQTVTTHNKVLMLDGRYTDDIVPRVYTGSANLTHLENSDDSQIRVKGRGPHDQYLSWFYDVRAACAANTP